MESITKIYMTVHTKEGTYQKLITSNDPKGYTKKDVTLAEKWTHLLSKMEMSVKLNVEV